MIGQRRPKLTARQEREAYAAATERDSVSGIPLCQRCGARGPMDRDHRQGRDAYNTTPGNLQLLGGAFGCDCHGWKTGNPAKAVEKGFTVPRWADPLKWPAWRFGVGWVLYLDAPDDSGAWWRTISKEDAMAIMGRPDEQQPW